MHERILNKIGFSLVMMQDLEWWVIWADEKRPAAPASEETLLLWEALEAEVTAQAKGEAIRATEASTRELPGSSPSPW